MARARTMTGLVVAVFVTLTATSEVRGQDARTTFREGVGLYNDGKYSEAAEKFKAAYEMKPIYKLLFNIGQAYAAEKKYDLAIQAFERYLVDGGDDVPEERRDEVLQEIGKMRPLVGFLGVEAPEGLTVYIDGEERGQTPLKAKIMMTVGHPHKVELRQGDEVVKSQELSVYGGMVETVKYEEAKPEAELGEVVLEEEPVPVEEEPEKEPLSQLKVWGWVALGTGAAVLAGGGAVGVVALMQDNAMDQACPDGTCAPGRQGEVDALSKLALTTDILLIAGGVIAATGLVLLVVPDNKEKAEPEVSVYALPGGLGATVRF